MWAAELKKPWNRRKSKTVKNEQTDEVIEDLKPQLSRRQSAVPEAIAA